MSTLFKVALAGVGGVVVGAGAAYAANRTRGNSKTKTEQKQGTSPSSFDVHFDKIDYVINDDIVKACANGTGYFDGFINQALDLRPGDKAKFTDESGRRGIVLLTSMGNIVLFERYSDDKKSIAYNAPAEFEMVLFSEHRLNDDTIERLIGPFDMNTVEHFIIAARGE